MKRRYSHILAGMRAEIQQQGRIPICSRGVSGAGCMKFSGPPRHPFYRSALPIEIGPIAFAELSPFVLELFEAGGRKVAGEISPGTVQKALAKLEALDIVFQPYDSKDYRFNAPFFRLWLISQVVYPLPLPPGAN